MHARTVAVPTVPTVVIHTMAVPTMVILTMAVPIAHASSYSADQYCRLYILPPCAPYHSTHQMAFYILRIADPGSLALAKSTAPYLVAMMLRCTARSPCA